MVELAVTTGIPVAAWRAEDDATIATAVAVLTARADAAKGR
jgi:hypothetical protein